MKVAFNIIFEGVSKKPCLLSTKLCISNCIRIPIEEKIFGFAEKAFTEAKSVRNVMV